MNEQTIVDERPRFARIDEWVFNAVLDDGAFRLYALLAMLVLSPQGYKVGRKMLAERCGCSLNTLDRRVRALKDAGVLRVEATTFNGGSGWNRLTLVGPKGTPKNGERVAPDTGNRQPQGWGPQEESNEMSTNANPPYPPVGGTTTRPKGMRVCDSCRNHGTIGVDMRRYERRRLARGDVKYGYLHSTCEPADKTAPEGWL